MTAALPQVAVLDDYQHAARRFGGWERLEGRIALTVFHDHVDDPQALVRRLAPFDAVCLMRERTALAAAVLAQLPRLRLVVTTAMVNAALDIAAAQALGITVCGTGAVHTGTPELVWLHILALARRLPAESRAVAAGGWQAAVGKDLYGSTLGILGLGRVGGRVARVGHAFGMQVLAWSPRLTAERAAEHGARCVDKATLFRASDFVVLAVKYRDSTRHIVGAQELALMRRDAFLVNTARGPLVDEQALTEALQAGRIAGAGLDAFSQEPLPADHPFRRMPNVLVTPHIGYVTEATYAQFHGETVECVQAWLQGRPVRLLAPSCD